jgi:hypothetical protein
VVKECNTIHISIERWKTFSGNCLSQSLNGAESGKLLAENAVVEILLTKRQDCPYVD